MPICPHCLLNFHRGAEHQCPSCGFSVPKTEALFGNKPLRISRLTDNAGALNSNERTKITKELEKIERRISPAALAVYFPSGNMHNQFLSHAFWALNHGELVKDSFRWRKAPAEIEWLLLLVIDIHTGLACFTWSYKLDPYIDINRINSCIIQARLPMRDNDFVEAIPAIMHKAALHIAQQAHRLHHHSIAYPLLRSLALASTTSILACGMAAHSATAEEMPKWTHEDSKLLMKGEWWNQQKTAKLKNTNKPPEQQSFLPLTTSEELKRLPLLPEDPNEVPPNFLPEYPLAADKGIIDPQKLLNHMEKEELSTLLTNIKQRNKLKIYISLFAENQKVPAALNAPTLARNIFQDGERSVLLHIHLGDSRKTQIAFDPELSIEIPEEMRRSMLSTIKERATHFNSSTTVLNESVRLLAKLTQPSVQAITRRLKPERAETNDSELGYNIPPVSITLPADPVKDATSPKQILMALIEGQSGTAVFATLTVGLIASLIACWILLRRHVELENSEPDTRLSARVGASVSRAVSYRDGKETSRSHSSNSII